MSRSGRSRTSIGAMLSWPSAWLLCITTSVLAVLAVLAITADVASTAARLPTLITATVLLTVSVARLTERRRRIQRPGLPVSS